MPNLPNVNNGKVIHSMRGGCLTLMEHDSLIHKQARELMKFSKLCEVNP